MREPVEQIIDLVGAINDKVYDETGEHGLIIRPVLYSDDGIGQLISFMTIPIWDSENDEREPGQTLLDHVLEEVKGILLTVRSISLGEAE